MKTVRIDKHNVDSNDISDKTDKEFIKDLFRLKQRMISEENGDKKELTDFIKYEKRDKIIRNPAISKATLTGFPRKVADMVGFEKVMGYQVKSWEYIDSFFNDQAKENLIVSAPTGFGKTEAVIPAIINKVMEDDSLAIFIFPRRALLIDQIQRIMKYKTNGTIKMGLQMTEIKPKIEWTIYNQDNMRNVTIKEKEWKIKINNLSYTNYSFENDMFKVKYKNEYNDNVEINLFKCHCGGSFENLASFQSLKSMGKHKSFIQMNYDPNNSYWKCNNCGNRIYASFSREDHIRLKPNLLLTTIDSFLSIISDSDMADWIREKLKAVVFDEAHVYNSMYGNHASTIIGKIKEVTTNNILFAGLSATIDMPEAFGMKLFKSDIKVIEPEGPDVNKIKDGETYIFVKSSTNTSKGKTYPLTTQNMIQSTLLMASSTKGKLMAFMDSVDAVSKLARQTNDAYNVKKLYKFRLDDLINQQATYNTYNCTGLSPTCKVTCNIYKVGECWNILRDINGAETPARVDIRNVSSNTPIVRSELEKSRFIFTTSELELGIDLPDIKYLLEYKTPYTIFDYLQRKGRAGRDPDLMPVFLFILGEKSNDYVYFSHGSSILEKPYILPLEEKNTVLERLYNKLFDYYNISNQIYKEIMSERKIEDYVAKFIASWISVIGDHGIDPAFGKFLKERFAIKESGLRDINVYRYMTQFKENGLTKVEELRKDSETELNNLLHDSNDIDPLTYIDSNITKIIGYIKNLNADNLTHYIKKLNDLRNNVLEDMENEKDTTLSVKDLMKELDTLFYEVLFGTDLGGEIHEISGHIYNLYQNNHNFSKIQKRARELFFEIQSLKEMKTAFGRTANAEVIKYIMRANYFYMVPELLSPNEPSVTLPPMPPISLFSTSSRDIPLMESNAYKAIKNIDIRDSIFKYFPFRLNETYAPNEKYMVMPEITNESNSLYFSPDSIIDPVRFPYGDNKTALMPLSLKTETLRDDGINDIISYCPSCYKFYNYRQDKCSICHKELTQVTVYAEPIVKYDVSSDKWDSKSNNVYVSNVSQATILLKGVSIRMRDQYYDKVSGGLRSTNNITPLEVMARKPYGYKITTNSLKIKISDEAVGELLKKFRNKFPNRPGFTEKDVIHTLEHLWLTTISIVVGVSPDQFMYSSEGNDIIITELQEGGAGYIKAFVEYLNARTRNIVETIQNIIDCEEHENIDKNMADEFDKIDFKSISLSEHKKISDIISEINPEIGKQFPDKYPTCYDGCLYCIGLNSCNYGGEEQFDHLSLYVSEEYLKTIVKKTSDKHEAASMVSSGGIIVDSKDGEYGIFIL